MSRELENQCVDCGLPCLGISCPYRKVEMIYCDLCGDAAIYRIRDQDLCEVHTRKILQDEFNDLTVGEEAKVLGVKLDSLG